MGVRRAVEMVLDAPGKRQKPIFTYGPLIHNPQVLGLLRKKGISVLDDIPEKGGGTILIRAHGVPPRVKSELEQAGFTVIDATCPRVIRVQTIIKKHAKRGYDTIIIGDGDHPEVVGLLGHAGEKGHVAGTMAELERMPAFENAIIVAQTTQNTGFYQEVKQWTKRKFPHYLIFETICDSTEKRQTEVRELASAVDALIVVGGKNSGNTQRLAEIAKQAGIPAFHIETEEELDTETLGSVQRIGITAGASTPNWIIKRISRTIEMLPQEGRPGLSKLFRNFQRALLLTNIYVSLGAGFLCYACCMLQGIANYYSYVLISILYIQSMHIFNHLTGKDADRYNDPDRALFYENNSVLLTLLGLIAGAAGLLTAASMGVVPFLTLLVMSGLGLSYNLRIAPESLSVKYPRIRDIPGSKTVLIAVAWGIVTAVFPALSATGRLNTANTLVFIWSTGIVFSRTVFFDILDMQGDRIVGKDTIPILLGEKRAMKLLKFLLATVFLILAVSSLFRLFPSLGYGLALCPVYFSAILFAYAKRHMASGIRLEFLVETGFLLSGIVALAWPV